MISEGNVFCLRIIHSVLKIPLRGLSGAGLSLERDDFNCICFRMSYLPKYLSNSPLNALPCLASSRAIS